MNSRYASTRAKAVVPRSIKSLMKDITRSNKRGAVRNRFRIIGGEWRGRRLTFPDVMNIRPTPDRVRETLFNWLQARVIGARCLDLFAGSGALGLEALSRGATEVVFVERDAQAARTIEEHIALLGAKARVQAGNAFDFLRASADTFDVVFLDPPFGEAQLKPALQALLASGALKKNALVYVEAASGELADSLPAGFELLRRKKAGQVEYGLAVPASDDETTF